MSVARLRVQVFLGIFVGYAAYYLVRKNLSFAGPDILKEHPQYTKAMLGSAMTGLSIAYGISKFAMGALSDRSNPRVFLPVGLLLSCAIMLFCGTVRGVFDSLAVVTLLMVANGWVQGMGWPACGKTLVHWFSTKERGRAVALWNGAHNVGGGLAAWLAGWGALTFHTWGAKFTVNAAAAAALAVVAFLLMRDTPRRCGLPPVEESAPGVDDERPLAVREIFLKHVLNNRYLWAIAIANAFLYFVRYGIADWIPTYLKTAKGFTTAEYSNAAALFELAGIPGTILCGWVSDKVFGSRRAPAMLVFTGLTLLAVVAYAFNARGPHWVDFAALGAIGFLVYGPIMIVGLHALDLVPKNAAGTAAGFTGLFGYVFGSAFAGTGVGWIADNAGWSGVFVAVSLCCVLTMAFSALTLGRRTDRPAPEPASR